MDCRHCDNPLRFRRKVSDHTLHYYCDHCEIHVWYEHTTDSWTQQFWDAVNAVPKQVAADEESEMERLLELLEMKRLADASA